jgi:hypothetical protein
MFDQPIPDHMKKHEYLIHLPPLDEDDLPKVDSKLCLDDCYTGSIVAVLTPSSLKKNIIVKGWILFPLRNKKLSRITFSYFFLSLPV